MEKSSQSVSQIQSQVIYESPRNPSSNCDFSIVTPVPLLYSARSKAVLNSMISSGSSDSNVCAMNVAEHMMELEYPDSEEDHSGKSTNDTQAIQSKTFKLIRPISPSTLIALTEPFLMTWCTKLSPPPPPSLPPNAPSFFCKRPVTTMMR